MKLKFNAALTLALLGTPLWAQNPPAGGPAGAPSARPQIKMLSQPQSQNAAAPSKDDLSYSIGIMFGSSIKRANFDVDPDTISKAIKDVLAGKETRISEKQANEYIHGAMMASQQEVQKKRQEEAEKNKQAGKTFLAENAKKEGVKTLPDGLQYKVITEGKGDSPKASDVVNVQYKGTLIDGTEFDSSYKRGQAATFPVSGVIKGWTEALQLMKPGAKWELYVPSDLAYGDMGRPSIPPGSTLIFEVELVSVKPTEQPAANSGTNHVVSGEIIKVPSQEEMKKGAKIEVIKQSDATNAAKTNK